MSVTAPNPAPTQPSNLFGQIITAGMVERAMVASLDQWMDTYLGQIERIETDGTGDVAYQADQIQRPLGIITHSDFEKWPEDQLPVIVVMCAGLNGQPERHAQGEYRAEWTVAVAALVSDIDQDHTRRISLAYGAAVRAAVLQHRMLKSGLYPTGFSSGTYWLDETYNDMPALADRSIAAARVTFSVAVDSVVTEQAGPRVPLTPAAAKDPGNWPTVKPTPTATVTPIPIEDNV